MMTWHGKLVRSEWPERGMVSLAAMGRIAIAAVLVCASSPSRAADLVLDAGAGPVIGTESTHSFGFRGSLGIDFGIVEPAFVALWSPGPDPRPVMHVGQQGAQLLHGIAGLLRIHTPAPHQAGLGVGFGYGQMEAAQEAGADAFGYRGTSGPYTVIELAYRYSAGPVTLGAAFTTHFFTHVQLVGDIGSTIPGPHHYGLMTFFSFMANLGLRLVLF
jgi:hypothetical protein